MNKILQEKIKESLQAILPVAFIILVISIIMGIELSLIISFLIGVLLLISGLILFSIGSSSSMMPIAEGIGKYITKRKSLILMIIVAFIIGFLITAAEPDLWVLADQFVAIPTVTLILAVACGVGLFLVLALLRIVFQIKLSILLLISYTIVFILAFIVQKSFIPIAFDFGGASTGPITVPFIMALGLGVASARGDANAQDESFGLVGLCSLGPIFAVLILGLVRNPEFHGEEVTLNFFGYFKSFSISIGLALLPFLLFFIIFQVLVIKTSKREVIKILIGFVFTFIGLVLFLTGANYGLLDLGGQIGETIVKSSDSWLFIPMGMILGFVIVAAEPAVGVLTKQVEEMTSGAIPKRMLTITLSIGIAIAVGLAALRILTGWPLLYFLLPGYLIALLLTFKVPDRFTAIAFDSGGAASGAMTASFLVPLGLGASLAIPNSNPLTDAFGLVALVAMTPLVTIQILGLIFHQKAYQLREKAENEEIINVSEGNDEIIDNHH
ncbi:MAG: DUF1538 domain-containing protein [Bacilli bacterium]